MAPRGRNGQRGGGHRARLDRDTHLPHRHGTPRAFAVLPGYSLFSKRKLRSAVGATRFHGDKVGNVEAAVSEEVLERSFEGLRTF